MSRVIRGGRGAGWAAAIGVAVAMAGCGDGGDGSPEGADAILTSMKTVPTVRAVPFEVPATAICPTTSHPFSTMLCTWGEDYDPTGAHPIDLKQYGYTEREFFQSGQANIYDLDADERALVLATGKPYTTRLLVRYPDESKVKFSGRVFIDIMNASSGVDLEDVWRRSWKHMMLSGDAYIGITSKALTADALKKFDPARYADINWKVDGVNEDGLVWDMLSQLGTALRQNGTSGLLGTLQPRYVYLSGQSQSGFYMNTYIAAFGDRLERAGLDRKPLFDGYLNLVGTTATVIRTGGKRPAKVYRATGVPQIAVLSEAESGSYATTQRADANAPNDKFRYYQIAAAPHSDPTSPIIPINTEIMKAKADGKGRDPKPYAKGHEEDAVQIDDFVSAALENLHEWAANGIPAPPADTHWIKLSATVDNSGTTRYSPQRDQYGNTLGGLRSPILEAPLYRFYAMAPTATGGSAFDWGSMQRLPDATINGIHGGSCAKYLASYDAALKSLLDKRYIHAREFDGLRAKGRELATALSDPLATGTPVAIKWTAPCTD